mgnify:CR=1 FL=1
MNKKNELPNKISVFPISNFIIFPKTTVPLNIFEPRYIKMVDDSMKSSRMIGMVQPKKKSNKLIPELYEVGCVGKITSFNESEDGRYLIILNGLSRFKIIGEIKSILDSIKNDIRESARAFTGYAFQRNGDFYIRPRKHDEGTKEFFDNTGNFDGDDTWDEVGLDSDDDWTIDEYMAYDEFLEMLKELEKE